MSQKSPANVPIGREAVKRSVPPPPPKISTTPPRAKHQDGEQLTAWLFSLPGLLMLTLFLIVPFLMAFYFSFTDQRLIRRAKTLGSSPSQIRAPTLRLRAHGFAQERDQNLKPSHVHPRHDRVQW